MKHSYDTQLSSDPIKVILICSDIKLGKKDKFTFLGKLSMQSVFLLYMISGITILMGIYGPPHINTNSHCGGIPGYKYISMQQCWIDLLALINIMTEWMNKTHRRSETGVCNPGAAFSLRTQGGHSLSLQGPVSLTHTQTHTYASG